MAMMADTVAARSAVSRSRSRTWTRSIPASIAYRAWAAGTLARPQHQCGTAASDRSRDEESGLDLRIRALADRHVVSGPPGGEHRHELGEAGNGLTSPRPLMAPREVVRDESAEGRPRLGEVIPLPESRPGQDDEQQSRTSTKNATRSRRRTEQSAPPRRTVSQVIRAAQRAVHPTDLTLMPSTDIVPCRSASMQLQLIGRGPRSSAVLERRWSKAGPVRSAGSIGRYPRD